MTWKQDARGAKQSAVALGRNQYARENDEKKIRFATLWKNYPSDKPYVDPKTGKPPQGFENQCAIKLSVALHKSGVDMTSFKGNSGIRVNGINVAASAEDLAAWLKQRPYNGISRALDITGKDWKTQVSGRTGIIFFKDYWKRDEETNDNKSGDHIDLWNGSELTSSGLLGALTTFSRFTIGLDKMPGIYSDLGNSTQILFWEVK